MVLLLAVPVSGASAFDVIYRSTHLSATEQAYRTLGGSDAVLDWRGYPIVQAPNPNTSGAVLTSPDAANHGQAPASPPLRLLPPGSTTTPEADSETTLIASKGAAGMSVRGVDLDAPGPAAGVRVRSGSVPTGPGQIALSPAAASQLRTGINSTVVVPGSGINLTVVGIVADRYHPGETVAFTTASTAEQLQDSSDFYLTGITRWYVSAPGGVTWADVEALNQQGWQVTSRLVIEHPPTANELPYNHQNANSLSPAEQYRGSAPIDHRTTEVGAGVLAALLVLEVVLLCGPAFAIGTRRRRQQLGVIAAGAGAGPSQLAWFVVADGLLLGVTAAIVGAAAGIGVGAAILAFQGSWAHQVPGPLTLRGWEITGVAALAVLSGILSSLVPAWSASRNPSRRNANRQLQWRWTWPSGAAGLGLVAIAAALGTTQIDEPSNGGAPVPLVAAAALGEIGLVCLTPALLALTGRVAGRLPLWPRIALRQTARSRSAAAAAAAVIAVMAAAAAALIYSSSVAAHDRVSWLPSMPVGDAAASVTGNSTPVDPAAAYAAVRSGLPGSTVLLIDGDTSSSRPVIVLPPGCTTSRAAVPYSSGGASSEADSGGSFAVQGATSCAAQIGGGLGSYFVASGPPIGQMIGGAAGQQASAALQAGKAVVFDPHLIAPDGKITVGLGQQGLTTTSVPAVAVESKLPVPVVSVIFPPTVASALHLDAGPNTIYVKDAAAQPASRLQAVNVTLTKLGLAGGLYVQNRYTNSIPPTLWAITGGSTLLVVAATVVAAALLTVDASDDLSALWAVGADRRGRRRLAMSRVAVICVLGTAFGAAAGILPGAALVWRLRQHNLSFTQANAGPIDSFAYPLSFPWVHLAAIVVAAPLLATILTALLTRPSRPARSIHSERLRTADTRSDPVGVLQ